MDEKDIAEQAYKNGYEQALKDIRSDLSDEAIVKVLEERVNYINEEFERTKTPINFMMIGVDAVVVCDTLDLIRCLQKENERLKIDLENEKNWGKIQTRQAVKDTADKIFRQVLRLYQGLSKAERETMTFEWKLLDLAVEFGVEVEW